MSYSTKTDWVDCAALATAIDRFSELSLSQICRNLGWVRETGTADTTRLQRRLGRMTHHSVKGGKTYTSYQKMIKYSLALDIARAAGVDPIDVEGL
jgi:hypothetical protein